MVQVALIEKRLGTGPGIAYGTDNPLHLLSVPAGEISAFPEKPLTFSSGTTVLANELAKDYAAGPRRGQAVIRRLKRGERPSRRREQILEMLGTISRLDKSLEKSLYDHTDRALPHDGLALAGTRFAAFCIETTF